MNKVMLIGRWTRDLELRFTQQGTAVATGTLAVDDGYGDKKKTYFHTIVIWGKTAEATANYSKKGNRIAIEGRLTQRNYEKDNMKIYVTEVYAEQVHFLEIKERTNDPFKNDATDIDISDENDLPF